MKTRRRSKHHTGGKLKPFWLLIKEWCQDQPKTIFHIKEVARGVFPEEFTGRLCDPTGAYMRTMSNVWRKKDHFELLGEGLFRVRNQEVGVEEENTRARIRQIDRVIRQDEARLKKTK